MVVALTLSPKLFLKIAIENGLPLQPQCQSTTAHVSRIYTESLTILARIEGLEDSTAYLMHDRRKLYEISAASSTTRLIPLELINDYFGSQVALYFSWLEFYSNCLYVPAVAGGALFVTQLYTGKVRIPTYCPCELCIVLIVVLCVCPVNLYVQIDSAWGLPPYTIFILLWGEYFLSSWTKECAVLTYSWGVMGADEAKMKSELSKQVRAIFYPCLLSVVGFVVSILKMLHLLLQDVMISNKTAKYVVTTPIMVMCVLAQVAVMVYSMHLMDNAADVFGEDSLLKVCSLHPTLIILLPF
jgi:hypothetical protein